MAAAAAESTATGATAEPTTARATPSAATGAARVEGTTACATSGESTAARRRISVVARSIEGWGCAEGARRGSGRGEVAARTGHEPGRGPARRVCHFGVHPDHCAGEAFTQRTALDWMDAGLEGMNGLALEVEGARRTALRMAEGLSVLRAAVDRDQRWHARTHGAWPRSIDGSAARARRRDVSGRSIPDVVNTDTSRCRRSRSRSCRETTSSRSRP